MDSNMGQKKKTSPLRFYFFFYYFSACNMFLKSQECIETFNSDSQNLKPLHVAVLIPSMHFSLYVSITSNQILS